MAGPAVGFLYADEYRRAHAGIIFRGAVGVVSSAVILALALDDLEHLFDATHEGNDDAIAAVATIGLGAIAASALIDVARLPRVVRDHNRKVTASPPSPAPAASAPPTSRLEIAPFYSLRSDAVGVRVARSF